MHRAHASTQYGAGRRHMPPRLEQRSAAGRMLTTAACHKREPPRRPNRKESTSNRANPALPDVRRPPGVIRENDPARGSARTSPRITGVVTNVAMCVFCGKDRKRTKSTPGPSGSGRIRTLTRSSEPRALTGSGSNKMEPSSVSMSRAYGWRTSPSLDTLPSCCPSSRCRCVASATTGG